MLILVTCLNELIGPYFILLTRFDDTKIEDIIIDVWGTQKEPNNNFNNS